MIYDYEERPDATPPTRKTPADTLREMHRLFDTITGIDNSSHRCVHGINLEKATCGRCLDYDYNQP